MAPKGMPPLKRTRLGSSPLDFDSDLAGHLVDQWCWGYKSAIEVQREAHLSYRDQTKLLESLGLSRDYAQPSLTRLARLRNWGAQSSNVKTDLVTAIGEPKIPEACFVQVFTQHLKAEDEKDSVIETAFPILLPHESFAHMFHEEQAIFGPPYRQQCSGIVLGDFRAS